MQEAFINIFMWVILPLAAISIYFAFKAGATKTILGIIAGVALAAFFIFADRTQIEALGDAAGRAIQFIIDAVGDLFAGAGAGGNGNVQP